MVLLLDMKQKKEATKQSANDILKINYFLSKASLENRKNQISETLDENDIDLIFTGKPFKRFYA